MTPEQIVQIAQNGSFLIFALMLWWSERKDRVDAEKRERSLLREVAKLTDQE